MTAEQTYQDICDEIEAIYAHLFLLSLALGEWHAHNHPSGLQRVAYAANGIALAARRIETLAEGKTDG